MGTEFGSNLFSCLTLHSEKQSLRAGIELSCVKAVDSENEAALGPYDEFSWSNTNAGIRVNGKTWDRTELVSAFS